MESSASWHYFSQEEETMVRTALRGVSLAPHRVAFAGLNAGSYAPVQTP